MRCCEPHLEAAEAATGLGLSAQVAKAHAEVPGLIPVKDDPARGTVMPSCSWCFLLFIPESLSVPASRNGPQYANLAESGGFSQDTNPGEFCLVWAFVTKLSTGNRLKKTEQEIC